MCLSNVYRDEQAKKNLLATEVASIEMEGDVITLTDLFGRKTRVEGRIRRADLTGGVVILELNS